MLSCSLIMAVIGIPSGLSGFITQRSHLLIQGLRIGKIHLAPLFGLSHPQLHERIINLSFSEVSRVVLMVIRLDHTMVVNRNGDDVRYLPRSCLSLHPWRPSMCAIAKLVSSPM